MCSRLRLQGGEHLRVADVRRESASRGVPLFNQGSVDHLAVRPDVAEEPPELVGLGDVSLQPNGHALHQLPVSLACLAAEALHGPLRVHRLRRIDADVAHPELPTAYEHVDGVTVDHVDDECFFQPDWRWTGGGF